MTGFFRIQLILCFCLFSASAEAKKKDLIWQVPGHKTFSLSSGATVNNINDSYFIDFSVNIPKGDKDLYYIPYITLYFQHGIVPVEDVASSDDLVETDISLEDNISSAVLGIKAGVLLPTLMYRQPVYFYANAGFGKISTQSDPWFGQPNESLGKDKLHHINLGLRFYFNDYWLGYNFSKSDYSLLGDHQSLFLGVNY